MELTELIQRTEKEILTVSRNLDLARKRGAPDQDVKNLENKLEYKKAILDILNASFAE